MKKFIVFLILVAFSNPCYAFLWWNKKDKALEAELEGKGYAGTLPNLNKKFEKKEQKVTTPIFESQDGFNDPSELKPAPIDNPAFINIIQKKDKTSKYLTDANEIIPMIERLMDCIEENGNIQLFVTRANVLSMNIDNLMKKYEGQPESYYESFRKLEEINRYVKSIAQLRREAQTYQRYLAYQESGSIYNPENIQQQLQYLLDELNSAVLLLRAEE